MVATRQSARRRLTLLYACLFLLLGTLVLGIGYALASNSATISLAKPTLVTTLREPGGRVVIERSNPTRVGTVAAEQHNADLRRLLAISWVVLLIMTAGAALVGWFVAGRFLRPLREMTAKARTISAGNLGQRLALAGREDEFKQLGDTVDDLLARLEASFEGQRRFVANAAHELRTPLTLERTLLQVALADPDASAASLRATCEELLAFGREQERLLEALLTLASSERGLEHREAVDLAGLAQRVVVTVRPEVERRSLVLTTELVSAPTNGDPALIERLIANLVDNAVRYSDEGGRVEVATGIDGDHALFKIANTGPIVSSGEVERLFEPFHRLGAVRTFEAGGHHGLGLSLVRAIATAHGASIAAVPQPDGGLAVTVSFTAMGPEATTGIEPV